mmetsp:Transcript_12989/g.23415  ORF Transcript_12989/g.23415 Transcript_12989/m.23415 type:complete len:172 (-) Transcript_12989:19-534(-)
METSQGNVTLENCEHFYRGCPETDIWKYEFYRYPACQSINRKLRCYLLDPSCPLADCENGDKSMAKPSNDVLVAFLVLSIITIIAMLVYHFWTKRRQKQTETQTNKDASLKKPRRYSDSDITEANIHAAPLMARKPFSPEFNERTTKLTPLETTKQEKKLLQSKEVLVDLT